MHRKSIFIIVLFVSGFLPFSWASGKQEHPNLWAALSVSRPLFHAGSTKELFIHFTLVNDGSKTINPKIESSKIIINGEELKDSSFILSNGPRDSRWNALPPGDTLEFTYALEDYFKKPGTYTVSWKSDNFESPTIVFRVMPNKANP